MVGATKYIREANKSSSATPLRRSILVKTKRLELGRKGCEVTEPNKGTYSAIKFNQQIEQCDASEEVNACENRKTRIWQEKI